MTVDVPGEHTAAPTRQRSPGTRAGLALVAGCAWVAVIANRGQMHPGVANYMVAWTLMMAAMMLPSVTPLVLLYRCGASAARTAGLVIGYLAVWAAVGGAAYGLDRAATPPTTGPPRARTPSTGSHPSQTSIPTGRPARPIV